MVETLGAILLPKRSRKNRNRSADDIGVARARGGQAWILIHPRSVRDRSEDLEEVHRMIAGGEIDIAIDELRWLVDGCREMISAHYLLGRLAVEVDHDLPLARGHFGFGYELGMRALKRNKMPVPVPADHPANRPMYDAGRGLAWCLHEMDMSVLALEVLEKLIACDPRDPLGLKSWIDQIHLGDKQVIRMELFPG
jgi:hypothetical protein